MCVEMEQRRDASLGGGGPAETGGGAGSGLLSPGQGSCCRGPSRKQEVSPEGPVPSAVQKPPGGPSPAGRGGRMQGCGGGSLRFGGKRGDREGQATAAGGRGWEAAVLPRLWGGEGSPAVLQENATPTPGPVPEHILRPTRAWGTVSVRPPDTSNGGPGAESHRWKGGTPGRETLGPQHDGVPAGKEGTRAGTASRARARGRMGS